MSEEVDDFVIHGGQSSVTAHGRCATSEQHAWTIGLRHPLRPEKRLAEFYLKDQSLATSGSATQHFVHQGQRYGHVLDPRTGRPAMNVYSSTVIAPTAAEADALSTAFYVMGPAAALEYCRERPHLATVITCPGPRQGSIEVHHTGLPEDTWELREGTTT
jgi:thiamine biosynthesis lipoprotein